jgi:hypothetical protein
MPVPDETPLSTSPVTSTIPALISAVTAVE